MTVNLQRLLMQRPLIVGSSLLVLGIAALDSFHHLAGEWGIYTVFALLGAAGVQWLYRQTDQVKLQVSPVVDSATMRRTLTEVKQVITHLHKEIYDPVEKITCAEAQPRVLRLQSQISQLTHDLNREELRIAVMGAKGTGKTTLLQLLQLAWGNDVRAPRFSEVSSVSETTTIESDTDRLALQQVIATDLVLFIVTGDLTESELQLVKQVAASKRTVLVFNKLDQYLPIDCQCILGQLRAHVGDLLFAGDVVTIAAAPNPIKVRQHQLDGSINEWLEAQPPNLTALTQRLEQILTQESQKLVLASSLNHAIHLKNQAKTVLNDVRRIRALPVVEQFQWVAAGTAFASPIPTLDVLATAAINAQMILDLGTLYRQKFSLQQAQRMAATLGSLILKLGLVELATQAIAGLLKVNALTYIAGGCIQGVSAAYLTRIVGLSLIEYFQTQEPKLTLTEASPLAIERFSQIVQSVFQKNQQLTFLQSFAWQAMERVVSPSVPQQPRLAVTSEIFTSEMLPEPLRLPLKTASTFSEALSECQEVSSLGENGSSVRLSVPSLDTTSIASNRIASS